MALTAYETKRLNESIMVGRNDLPLTPEDRYILSKACMESGDDQSRFCKRFKGNPTNKPAIQAGARTFRSLNIKDDYCFASKEQHPQGKRKECLEALLKSPKYYRSTSARKDASTVPNWVYVSLAGVAAFLVFQHFTKKG